MILNESFDQKKAGTSFLSMQVNNLNSKFEQLLYIFCCFPQIELAKLCWDQLKYFVTSKLEFGKLVPYNFFV